MYYKKKILMVVHAWGIGGVRTSTINLANALHEKGYELTIVTTSNKFDGRGELHPNIRLIVKEEKQSRFLRKLPYFRNFFEPGMWSTRQSPKKLYRHFIGKEQFDVEIAQFFGRPLKVVYGSPNGASKKLLWIHSDFSYGNNKGYLSCFKHKEEAIKAYHAFDVAVSASKGVKESFEKAIGRKKNNEVIYNLNNTKRILELADKDILKKEKFTFVFVGRLSSEKGVMRLLRSVKKLNDEGFDFDCWIVGDGEERTQAERFIVENEMVNVTMFGQQQNPYPYIKQADFLVLPSKAEAYGLSLSEALILHTPALATDCVGPKEILNDGEYGLLVKNTDESIYEGMKAVLKDNKLVDFYRENAKERAAFFQEERILEQIERILN
ncbi:MAG: glycosyltransferase [Clostridia bacterium]|nr:glycosyltransferase [Clostridia bacterium]